MMRRTLCLIHVVCGIGQQIEFQGYIKRVLEGRRRKECSRESLKRKDESMIVKYNDNMSLITLFDEYTDLIEAGVPAWWRYSNVLGFSDNDDTLTCSGGGWYVRGVGLSMKNVAGTDRSCRRPDCSRSFTFYPGAGIFWAEHVHPTHLYITSARPQLFGEPKKAIEYLKSAGVPTPTVVYGDIVDSLDWYRFLEYGKTKCSAVVKVLAQEIARSSANMTVVIVGDDGQGDVYWAQCVRDSIRRLVEGNDGSQQPGWWKREPWHPQELRNSTESGGGGAEFRLRHRQWLLVIPVIGFILVAASIFLVLSLQRMARTASKGGAQSRWSLRGASATSACVPGNDVELAAPRSTTKQHARVGSVPPCVPATRCTSKEGALRTQRSASYDGSDGRTAKSSGRG